MRTRTFHLDQAQADALMVAYHNTNDGTYRTRLQAVRLYGLDYPTPEITSITGAARSSLMDWCRAYRQGGLAALDDHRLGGNSAKLTPDQIVELSSKLRLYTPRSLFGPDCSSADGQYWTVTDLRRAVEYWYQISYKSDVSYYSLLARCEFSYQQPAKVFKSRNQAAVAAFEEQLEKN